jgi:YD repeat-containing protein
VTDAADGPSGSNVTTMHYDGLGRKEAMDDPDMGHWEYRYDDAGNLTKQLDARGQAICFYYDQLHRLKGKTYHENVTDIDNPSLCGSDPGSGNYATEYIYDCGDGNCPSGNYGVGQRTGMSDDSGSTAWTYDARGRVTKEEKLVNGITDPFVTRYTQYDAMDRVMDMVYPDGEVVHHTYDSGGALETLSGSDPYVTGIDHNEMGQIETLALGNTLTTQYTYDDLNFRLERIQVGSLLDLSYTYDNVGNVQTIVDAANGGQIQHFTYDTLDRLTHAWTTGGGNGAYDRTYAYDEIGNVTYKGGMGNYLYNEALW